MPNDKLRRLLWTNNSRTARKQYIERMAQVEGLRILSSNMRFLDYEQSNEHRDSFGQHCSSSITEGFPSREPALEVVDHALSTFVGNLIVLPRSLSMVGVFAVDSYIFYSCYQAFLKFEGETLRLITESQDSIICLFTQEGAAPHFERLLNIIDFNRPAAPQFL